jgi:DNA-binding CsgD family transcriptional regulator
LAYHDALQLWASIRDRWFITDALAGLAELASAYGPVSAAATLLGGIDALVEEAGGVHRSSGGDSYQCAKVSARAALGDARFAELYAAGRELTWEEIVTTASSVPIPTGRTNTLLTVREHEVLLMVSSGQTDREIAAALFVSHRTVNNHVASILAKLEAPSRRAAVSVARERGWLTPVD